MAAAGIRTDQPSSEPSGSEAWQPPTSGTGEPSTETPSWQPPAYTPQQYPQYQQPSTPSYTPPQQYPPTEQFGQQPAEYSPSAYPPPGSVRPVRPAWPARAIRTAASSVRSVRPGRYGQYPQYTVPGPRRVEAVAGVIGGIIGLLAAAIVALVLVLGFWKPGFFVTTKLDINSAQSGVQQILTDEANGYGAKNVKDVKCNDGQSPTVKKGDTFNCEVSIDGTKRQVTVTFQDDSGTYEVGRPK